MLEIEMKFVQPDLVVLRRRLAEWGALPAGSQSERDAYYNAPDRDFAKTDEALRVRHLEQATLVTYKGPRLDSQTKTRREIELPLGVGKETAQQFAQLLQALGYRLVAEVCKQRVSYHLRREDFQLEICIDEVQGLGSFVELEIQAPESDLDRGRATLLQTAAELGLHQGERRSYLELLLTAGAASPSG